MQNGSVRCEGISIWQDISYRIVGRCQGLVYPYSERLDRYYLWVTPQGGKPVQISDVRAGIFDASSDKSFSSMFITAEDKIMPENPGKTIVSATIEPFPFGSTIGVAPTPITQTLTPTPIATSSAGLGSLFTKSPFSVFSSGAIVVLFLLLIGILVFVRR